MQNDCILVALGLPQLRVLWQKELEDHFEVTVIYRVDEVTCPRCGEVTTKEHDRRIQRKQDRRLRERVRLNQIFYLYPELGKAWILKENFRAWYSEIDRDKAEESLVSLEGIIAKGSLPEFKELLHTLEATGERRY